MSLSEKLKQARLEAGLSQKRLCGEKITRNMLSQIENGSARPSMDTLRYLAGQLGKPVSFFLEEDTVVSSNQSLMEQARQAEPASVLEILKDYPSPDRVFDPERWLMETLACLALAEDAIARQKFPYAKQLLTRAEEAGNKTPYFTADLQRRLLLLSYGAGENPETLADRLPDLTPELLLRAEAALGRGEYDRCAALLGAVPRQDAFWHYLMGQLHLAQSAYDHARPHFEAAWEYAPITCCRALEDCCRELGDFAGAYFYACKLRELTGAASRR